MASLVEPTAAELPLSSGSSGATVVVHPLLTGEQQAPLALFDRPRNPLGLARVLARRTETTWLPIPAFLVIHPQAGTLLIDTGFDPSVADDPKVSLGPISGRLSPIRMTAEQAVVSQLARHGLAPGDVRTVVMTHLHYDHASAIRQFPSSTFVVDRREWEAASRGGVLQGYRRAHFQLPFDWRTVEFGAPAAESPFEHPLDLLGDGSVRLVSTPGHTHGHLSVVLRLAGGELLVCGDAVYTLESLHRDLDPLFCADRGLYRRTRAHLREQVRGSPEMLVVPSHDPQVWAGIRERYE